MLGTFFFRRNFSYGRSGDRAGGQIHGVTRHVPQRCQSLAARFIAVQAATYGGVDRQLCLGRDEAAQGINTYDNRRFSHLDQHRTILCFAGYVRGHT